MTSHDKMGETDWETCDTTPIPVVTDDMLRDSNGDTDPSSFLARIIRHPALYATLVGFTVTVSAFTELTYEPMGTHVVDPIRTYVHTRTVPPPPATRVLEPSVTARNFDTETVITPPPVTTEPTMTSTSADGTPSATTSGTTMETTSRPTTSIDSTTSTRSSTSTSTTSRDRWTPTKESTTSQEPTPTEDSTSPATTSRVETTGRHTPDPRDDGHRAVEEPSAR